MEPENDKDNNNTNDESGTGEMEEEEVITDPILQALSKDFIFPPFEGNSSLYYNCISRCN